MPLATEETVIRRLFYKFIE